MNYHSMNSLCIVLRMDDKLYDDVVHAEEKNVISGYELYLKLKKQQVAWDTYAFFMLKRLSSVLLS